MDLEHLKNNPEQIQQLISILSSLLPSEENKKQPAKPKKTVKENRFDGSKIKTSRSKSKSRGINLFDKMSEKNEHKQDSEIDKKLSVHPPTQRRDKINLIKVQCRSCGKSENVSPSLIFDRERYKCNKCSSSAG
jgi:ribonuclease D